MSDVIEQVRETFETVGRGVPVPPFDETAFRAGVRRARRRRTARVTGWAAAAAGVAAVALVAVPQVVDRGSSGPDVAGGPSAELPRLHPEALPAPLYYSAGMRVMAATPDGVVHDLGHYESVVGSTAEGVLVVDAESEPVWIGSSTSGEGDGAYTFERGSGPVTLPETGPVQSLALSADGRWFAWLDLEDIVTVYDLKAGARVQSVEVSHNAYVTSVSDRGVLVSENRHLRLFENDGALEVPTASDGYGWVSDTAGDLATVADRDDVTRVYDVTKGVEDDFSNGTAELVTEVPGTGRLSAYGRGVVTVKGATAWLWTAGSPSPLTGLGGAPQSAGWLDEDHAVVTTAAGDGTALYLCPVADLSCTPVAISEEDVRLAE